MSDHPLKPFWEQIQRAMTLKDTGKPEEAEAVLQSAARRWPHGWFGFGDEAMKEKDYVEAIKRFSQVLQTTKNTDLRVMATNNIAGALTELGRRDEAKHLFEESLRLKPEDPHTLCNLGLCYFWDNDFSLASQYYQRSLAKDPHIADVEFYAALMDLKLGNWERGWKRYEARLRKPKPSVKKLETNKPEWTGKKVDRLLIVCEQGFGDTIMAARLAKLVKDRAKQVTWVTQKGLACIVGQVAGVDKAIDEDLTNIEFDAHAQSMSLFRILGITPATLPRDPYIPTPTPHNYGPGFHVGIAWRGSKAYANDAYRSSPLIEWSELLDTPNVTFHSMQATENAEQAAFADKLKIEELPHDWAETQRRLAGLDLYISVDSGPVHMSGAMGKRTWVILPKSCDFRWGVDQVESLFYPSVKLFRLKENFRWREALADVKQELCRLNIN